MAWSKKLIQLNDALALLIPFPNVMLTFLERAKIDYTMIDFSGGSLAVWNNVLRIAGEEKIRNLVEAILEKHPDNPYLLAYLEDEVQDYNPGPDIKSISWKSRLDDDTKEKITGAVSTLLPIRFLEDGLTAAKCVARIKINGPKGAELGSGFLVKDNILVTNNHVLKNAEIARNAEVTLDYEESSPGLAREAFNCSLDPDSFFRTSEKEDWTAVKIKEPVGAYGYLKLNQAGAKKGDFVSIIQHPGGRYKQIALFHNIVTYADNDIIQYLTDTEPGSSGSPVFNDSWEVVALHHSGGMLLEPGIAQKMLRNEGIAIDKIIKGLI